MGLGHAVLIWPATWLALGCAAVPEAPTSETPNTVLLAVPAQVSRQAEARLAGEISAPPPILVLAGLEVSPGEELTIEVLGPPESTGEGDGPVLGMAGLVGSPPVLPATSTERMTLVVPLNDAAAALLAGKQVIRLRLRVADRPGRPPLRFERAYFETGEQATEPAAKQKWP